MGETTGIAWTDHTWNPWHGCQKISPGCKNCYMYRDKERYGQEPSIVLRSKTTFKDPLKWKSGRVFTCSWSDFFIEEADPWRDDAWDIIRDTPHLTYQILTKRPERMEDHLPADWAWGWPNVWLGVSIENQKYADERLPILMSTKAAKRFISAEPLLGPIFIEHDLLGMTSCGRPDWVIVGGESGHDARLFDPNWAWDLLRQCRKAGTAFFMKQMGSHARDRFPMKHPHGADPMEWPEEFRVQEFPE